MVLGARWDRVATPSRRPGLSREPRQPAELSSRLVPDAQRSPAIIPSCPGIRVFTLVAPGARSDRAETPYHSGLASEYQATGRVVIPGCPGVPGSQPSHRPRACSGRADSGSLSRVCAGIMAFTLVVLGAAWDRVETASRRPWLARDLRRSRWTSRRTLGSCRDSEPSSGACPESPGSQPTGSLKRTIAICEE